VPVQARTRRIRLIAYWILTIPVVFEMVAGSLWDVLQIEYVRVILRHLGYPLYVDFVMGPWKLAGAVAVIAPRFPRLKEWAYAGFFFNYYGAVASHLWVGDRAGHWIPPLVFAAFTLASWALRPDDRRLPDTRPSGTLSARAWASAVAVLAALLVVSYLTLPKGPPPGY
jgi:DoxX-like protein